MFNSCCFTFAFSCFVLVAIIFFSLAIVFEIFNLSLIDYPDGKGPDGFSLEKCFYDGDKNCDTFNFRYSPENVDGLAALGKTIAQSAMPQIRAAVQKSIHGKTKRTRRHGYLGTQLKRLKTKLFGRSS